MTALVGWSGLVGRELLSSLTVNLDCYNSKNIQDLRGKSYDRLYLCALPAEKWKINANPAPDAENIAVIQDVLKTVTVGAFVLISTVDVLNGTVEQDEDGDAVSTHAYGTHRRMFEAWVRENYADHYIIRLPGLFGKGLKKNVIYDLLFENNLHAISMDSQFQYYDLSDLAHDIDHCISNNIRLIQFVSEPVLTRDIVTAYFPELASAVTAAPPAPYQLVTKYGRYWNSAAEIMEKLGRYIAYERSLARRRLCISNIGFDASWGAMLQRYRVRALETAPALIRDDGTAYVSCQSILYNRPDLNLFSGAPFFTHLIEILEQCRKHRIGVIVFGSPKQRTPPVGLDLLDLLDSLDLHEYFYSIGEICSDFGVTFCLEPNARDYGNTWLTTAREVCAFVRAVDHPHVRMNYDTGNALMESELEVDMSWIPYIGHVQVSNRHLLPLTTMTDMDLEFVRHVVKTLRDGGYTRYISLEQRKSDIVTFARSMDVFCGLGL